MGLMGVTINALPVLAFTHPTAVNVQRYGNK
jgi:hypothetical protein